MLEFLVHNIYVVVAGQVFQQSVGIPMGTNCAPLLADLFLYSNEAEFFQKLLRRKHLLLWTSIQHFDRSTTFYRLTIINRDHSRHYSLDGVAVLSVVSRALKFKRLYVVMAFVKVLCVISGADPGIFKGGGPTLSKNPPQFFSLSPQLEKQTNKKKTRKANKFKIKTHKKPKNSQIPRGGGLNKAYARLSRPLGRREGSLLCHTCCDTGPRFFRSHPKERPFSRLLRHT
jgi:hypothetical protein